VHFEHHANLRGRRYYLFDLQEGLWIAVTCSFVTQFEGPIVMNQIGGVELWGPWVGALLDAFFVCVGENCG